MGLIQPDVLGEILRVITKAAAAIVVFEGGLPPGVREISHLSRAVLG